MTTLQIVCCLAVVTGIFAIGDLIGTATQAKISSVFVTMVIFTAGFVSGVIPRTILADATLQPLTAWAGAAIVFHMGTTIKLADFKREWRTVIAALIGMVGVAIGCIVAIPIIGKSNSLVAIPCVTGAIHATRIITEAALEKGLITAAALGTMIMAVQSFIGAPIASFCGRKEAIRLLDEYRTDRDAYMLKYSSPEPVAKDGRKKVSFAERHDKYFTDFACIAIAMFVAVAANWIQTFTSINNTVWALFIGIILGSFGLVPKGILARAKTQGFLNMITLCSVIKNLSTLTFDMLGSLVFLLVIVFAASLAGIAVLVFLTPAWKIVGSKSLAFGISACQLIGFPGTLLISNEISASVAKTPEEKEAILLRLTPAYVISGMVSVTTLSVILAGVVVNFL